MPFLIKGKTNWKYIAIVLILAILIGGGISIWIKRQEVPPIKFPEIKKSEKVVKDKTAKPIPSEVEGWKTYRNEKYGFEFKYPSGFKPGIAVSSEFLAYNPNAARILYGESARATVKKGIERNWTEQKQVDNALFVLYYGYSYQGMGGYSRVINAITQNPSKNYYVAIWIELDGLGGVPQTKEFWIDPTWQKSYGLTEKGEEWVIQKMVNGEEEEIKMFNQILSTFRFLE